MPNKPDPINSQEQLVRMADLEKILRLSRDSINSLRYTRGFPGPLDLGFATKVWRLADVEEWIKNQTQEERR